MRDTSEAALQRHRSVPTYDQPRWHNLICTLCPERKLPYRTNSFSSSCRVAFSVINRTICYGTRMLIVSNWSRPCWCCELRCLAYTETGAAEGDVNEKLPILRVLCTIGRLARFSVPFLFTRLIVTDYVRLIKSPPAITLLRRIYTYLTVANGFNFR